MAAFLTTGLIVGSVLSCGFSQDVSDDCLNCILKAQPYNLTDCEPTNSNPTIKKCGNFRITEAYFDDARIQNDELRNTDWRSCSLNVTCAKEVIRTYMKQYYAGCGTGTNLTCYHYARLHGAGPNGCLPKNLGVSDPLINNMTRVCGCEVLHSKSHCEPKENPTLIPAHLLPVVIAVPIACFILLAIVIGVAVWICYRSGRRNQSEINLEDFKQVKSGLDKNGSKGGDAQPESGNSYM